MILNRLSFHRKLIAKAAQIAVRNIHTSNFLKKNHYEVLGLSRDATQADIKNAYFELSKIYHPDRITATDENLARFREISDAYEVLGNEQSRRLYDRGLIGDFKRPGMEDIPEVIDPVIRFYKQRHEAKKPKAGEELEVWEEAYYKSARQKAEKGSQYYSVSKKHQLETDDQFKDSLFYVAFVIMSVIYYSNYKNTKAEEIWNYIFNFEQ